VVCDEPQFLDGTLDTLLNPTVIIEVLSESTEAYDRGRKFELYQSLKSLSEYLLIDSQRVSAGLFTRQPNGQWILTIRTQLEDSIDIQSVGCRLLLADLYEKIDFSPPQPDTAQP
jgi:Uma2 family endonuclease